MVLRQALSPGHPFIGRVELDLAHALRASRDCPGAAARYRAALEVLEQGAQRDPVREARQGLAACGAARP